MAENKNKQIISEELSKHMKLVEYTFYVGEDEDIVGNSKSDKNLLLGEEPEDEEIDLPDADTEEPVEEPMGEPVEEPAPPVEEPVAEPAPAPAPDMGDMSGDMGDMGGGMNAPMEDEVELDITQLVQGTEEAKMSADMANAKMGKLINQFNQLNGKLSQLEDLNSKIEELEQELIVRNPTEVEKLEMRSLDSFPYNLKLTDYWADKESEGNVQATGDAIDDESGEAEEFELTQDDIDSEYNTQQIPNSFNPDEDEDELDGFKYL